MLVIVLNCYSRNSLAVINSLDPSCRLVGGAIHPPRRRRLSPDSWLHAPRLQEVFRYPHPQDDPRGFVDELVAACRRYRAAAVIPTGTVTTNQLSLHRREVAERGGAVPVVEEYPKLSLLADKWLTYRLCRELQIPAPRSLLPVGEGRRKLDRLRYPLVVKPRVSFAAAGVRFLHHPREMEAFLRQHPPTPGSRPRDYPFLVQEAVAGNLHDVTSCAFQGEPVSLLSQRRLQTLYDFGGGGIINQTTHEPRLMEYAARLLRHLGWNGVLEFDFVRTPRGEYYLLECNPKFWGTTELTVKAGLNVCQQALDIFLYRKRPPTPPPYQVGLVYKYLVPECLYAWTRPPRSWSRVRRRLACTLRRYHPGPTITNLRSGNLRHLAGILLEKSALP